MIKLTSGALLLATAVALSLPVLADSPQEEARERAAERIERALERDVPLKKFDLDADAEGDRTGYIELEGRVHNRAQYQRAYNIARREAPGYRIVNKIKIGNQRR